MILQAIPWLLVLSQATKEWRLLNFHLIYWKLCKLLWNWRIESVLFCCNSGKVMNMESGRECTPPLGLLRRTQQRWPLSLLLCVTLLWNPFIAWPAAVTVFPTFLCSLVVSHPPPLFLNSWSVPWLGSSQHPSDKLLKRGAGTGGWGLHPAGTAGKGPNLPMDGVAFPSQSKKNDHVPWILSLFFEIRKITWVCIPQRWGRPEKLVRTKLINSQFYLMNSKHQRSDAVCNIQQLGSRYSVSLNSRSFSV